jgi:hypothetical protein
MGKRRRQPWKYRGNLLSVRACSMVRAVPLAPNPRRDRLITREARLCHWMREKIRVSRIS